MKQPCFLLIAIATTACNNNQAGLAAPDPTALAQYYECLATGNFPTAGREERLVARALDLAEQSGYFIRVGEEVEITGGGSVPVSIRIDGQEVIISKDLDTVEEKMMIRAAESAAASLTAALN